MSGFHLLSYSLILYHTWPAIHKIPPIPNSHLFIYLFIFYKVSNDHFIFGYGIASIAADVEIGTQVFMPCQQARGTDAKLFIVKGGQGGKDIQLAGVWGRARRYELKGPVLQDGQSSTRHVFGSLYITSKQHKHIHVNLCKYCTMPDAFIYRVKSMNVVNFWMFCCLFVCFLTAITKGMARWPRGTQTHL